MDLKRSDLKKKLLLPELYVTVEKTMEEFRLETYKMWLDALQEERDKYAFNVKHARRMYDPDLIFFLMTPKGKVLPMSAIEIQILLDFMQSYIDEREGETYGSIETL